MFMPKSGSLIIFFFISLGTSVFGQSVTTLNGFVTDKAKGTIAHAKIHVEKKGFRQTVMSEVDGKYELQLPDGVYKVRAERDGFTPSKLRRVRIKGNRIVGIDFVLVGIRNDAEHP